MQSQCTDSALSLCWECTEVCATDEEEATCSLHAHTAPVHWHVHSWQLLRKVYCTWGATATASAGRSECMQAVQRGQAAANIVSPTYRGATT